MKVLLVSLLMFLLLVAVTLWMDWIQGLPVQEMLFRLRNPFWVMDPVEFLTTIGLLALPVIRLVWNRFKKGNGKARTWE
ncbi:hypothetical protein C8P63_11240 [Melghirimyces profundicolus]|uniref:Uncharacterized protein n=1 Tax=Melghirimyces profundicolus TaxID=1242148 RepID=A0A2T6BTC9_9BACL|nr:hypothetical protein [Melghirimyces profundicolus]PTX59345.1 hypothetical protein C8P63_11240 [Melghirimyces profundicolus]